MRCKPAINRATSSCVLYKRQRGAAHAGYLIKRHQRHRTVMASTNGNAILIEEATDIISMVFTQIKGDQSDTIRRAVDFDCRHLLQRTQVHSASAIVRSCGSPSDPVHSRGRSPPQPNDSSGIRRAGLKLHGGSAEVVPALKLTC